MSEKQGGFLPWLYSFNNTSKIVEILGTVNQIERYYKNTKGRRCALTELNEREAIKLYEHLKRDHTLAKEGPQTHDRMLTVMQLFISYIRYHDFQLNKDNKTEPIQNATTKKATPAFEQQKVKKPTFPGKNPPPAAPYLRNIEAPVHNSQPNQHDKQIAQSLKQNKKATAKKYRLADELPSLYYKIRTSSILKSQCIPDPLHSLHRIEKNIVFSSYKWIYEEVIRRVPSLKPYVDQIKALPRPKSGEINQLIKEYHQGDAAALEKLLSYHYRVCLKAALRINMAMQTDLEETVSEANLHLLTVLPRLIRKNNNLSFLQHNLERELKRDPTPIWDFSPLPQDEYECTKTTESLQNISIQNNFYFEKPLSKDEITKLLNITEYDLQKHYGIQNENETIEPIESSYDQISISDLISNETDLSKSVVQITLLYYSLTKLTPRELAILCMRYGFTGNGIHTLREIGEHFSVTYERIRQIEAKAFKKIKYHYYRSKGAKSKETNDNYKKAIAEVQKLIETGEKKADHAVVQYSPSTKQLAKKTSETKKKNSHMKTPQTAPSYNEHLYSDIPVTDIVTNDNKIRKHFNFTGQVQGVGFLWRAWKAANLYKCTGLCQNEQDGSVTLEIQGTEEAIEQVILSIKTGHYVKIKEMNEIEIPIKPYETDFQTYTYQASK